MVELKILRSSIGLHIAYSLLRSSTYNGASLSPVLAGENLAALLINRGPPFLNAQQINKTFRDRTSYDRERMPSVFKIALII